MSVLFCNNQGGFYAAPKRDELTFTEQLQRTVELRDLQRGFSLKRVSSGGAQERGEVMPKAQQTHVLSGGDTQRRRKK